MNRLAARRYNGVRLPFGFGGEKRLVSRAGRLVLAATSIALLAAFLSAWPGAALAGDGTCGEASQEGSAGWYFAEGYTGPGFQEWLCLFNPGESWSDLDLHILYNEGESRVEEVALPPRSRVTLDINVLAGAGKEISLYLEATQPIVAERPMYFTYRGAWKGCTVASGAAAPSPEWYFAEGCTRHGFETWLLLANPAEADVRATVLLVLEDGSMKPVPVDLPPRSRRTVFVNDEVGAGHDVSARVEADAPVCAERVIYFRYRDAWPGGHASSGLDRPRRTYLFAEGYTGNGFEEWLTLYAPRDSAGGDGADVTVNCLFPGGEEKSLRVHLDPDRRHTLYINALAGEGKDVSLELTAEEPFLAERPMYFNYRGFCRGGHVSKGVEAPGTRWYLAEGTTRPGFHEYLCMMNPGDTEARVAVDVVCAQDDTTRLDLTLAARSRLTVDVRAALGTGLDTSFEVTSDRPVALERPLYYPTANFEVANAMDHLRHLSVNIGERIEGTAGEEEGGCVPGGRPRRLRVRPGRPGGASSQRLFQPQRHRIPLPPGSNRPGLRQAPGGRGPLRYENGDREPGRQRQRFGDGGGPGTGALLRRNGAGRHDPGLRFLRGRGTPG